jgi:hypothetical protein
LSPHSTNYLEKHEEKPLKQNTKLLHYFYIHPLGLSRGCPFSNSFVICLKGLCQILFIFLSLGPFGEG